MHAHPDRDLIREISTPDSGPKPVTSLLKRKTPLASAATQRKQLSELPTPATTTPFDFDEALQLSGCGELRTDELEILQINLGKLCNMSCRHCHVDAGPDRLDAVMQPETVEQCLRVLRESNASMLDITGGAPELHASFEHIVDTAVAMGRHVIDRCNLTILLLPRYQHLPEWLAERGVEIVASLPHYRARNTDAQRGSGTYDKSIAALRRLNEAGYGTGDPKRILTLMSNPAGAFLGGDQRTLEATWKKQLERLHGVTFDRLFVLNNMPISRFLEWLIDTGNLEAYMQKLLAAFNPAAVRGLMCRNTLSIGWDGSLYDCDFNQMLELPAVASDDRPMHIDAFSPDVYSGRRIQTARHCFGCTAGSGSSCGGSTS